MKVLKRILQIILGLVLLVVIGGFLFLNNVRNKAVPDYNEAIDLENLSAEVTVYRDSFAIPHIYAENELDLYRTVGYLMAQDRMWQLDFLRRVTLGRLSEIFGEDMIKADNLLRALDFPSKSKLVLDQVDPEIMECLEAYADGINQYISKNQKKLSFEFTMLGYKPEQWEPIHTVNLIGYMAWDLTSGWDTETEIFKLSRILSDELLQELVPDLDLQETYIFPEFMNSGEELTMESPMLDGAKMLGDMGIQVFEASNNWAVSGEKSVTGQPFMCNDMHLGYMSPGIWYQMHQVVDGKLNVTGVALPGAPFIICGHNDDIAWGMTNVAVDNMDFYLETINPVNPNQYKLDGAWKDMRLVETEIPVKGADPVSKTIRFTHRGPVVSSFKGIEDKIISARWLGNEFSNELRTVYLLNRAENWDDFRDAVSTFISIGQNIVYADKQGNIGLQTCTGVPIRKEGNGVFVYPGDTSLYDWKGIVPFEELPYTFNPESGTVSSANNRTVGDDYPYYIGTWFALPYRINRIREMLSEKDRFNRGDFERMIVDQVSDYARDFTPIYLSALQGNVEGIYGDALLELQDWDFEMNQESSAALIFEVLQIELTDALFLDELGDENIKPMYYIIGRNLIRKIRLTGDSPWCDNINTADKVESFEDNIRTAFTATVDTLVALYGDSPASWKWGELHKISLFHPMGSVEIVNKLFKTNRGPYAVGGSFHTVSPYAYPARKSFVADHGASERHIFDLSDWDASLTIIPTGNSGVPASPHYLDQTELFINKGLHADHFSREAVEKHALYKTIVK